MIVIDNGDEFDDGGGFNDLMMDSMMVWMVVDSKISMNIVMMKIEAK